MVRTGSREGLLEFMRLAATAGSGFQDERCVHAHQSKIRQSLLDDQTSQTMSDEDDGSVILYVSLNPEAN
jgi:hypothetical protein